MLKWCVVTEDICNDNLTYTRLQASTQIQIMIIIQYQLQYNKRYPSDMTMHRSCHSNSIIIAPDHRTVFAIRQSYSIIILKNEFDKLGETVVIKI